MCKIYLYYQEQDFRYRYVLLQNYSTRNKQLAKNGRYCEKNAEFIAALSHHHVSQPFKLLNNPWFSWTVRAIIMYLSNAHAAVRLWNHKSLITPLYSNTSHMYRGLIWMKACVNIKYKWPFIKRSRHRFPLTLYNPVNRLAIYLNLCFNPSGYQWAWIGNSVSEHCVNTIAQYTYSSYYFTIDLWLPESSMLWFFFPLREYPCLWGTV